MRARNVIALLIAGVFAMTSVEAATLIGPSSKTNTGSTIELAQAKKKAKATKKSGKKAKGKKKRGKGKGKAKACGKTYMYWDKKAGKCADARQKKTK